MEKAIKYDYIYNAVKELYEDSWAAEHVAYRNMLDLICNIPEEEIVDVEKLVAKSVRPGEPMNLILFIALLVMKF